MINRIRPYGWYSVLGYVNFRWKMAVGDGWPDFARAGAEIFRGYWGSSTGADGPFMTPHFQSSSSTNRALSGKKYNHTA